MHVTILDSNHKIFDGEARSVRFPGDGGQFEIHPEHAPLLSILSNGTIIIEVSRPLDLRWIPVQSGVVKVFKNDVVVLVDTRD